MTRKERERLAHRAEILLAARGVFAQRGFAGATMEEVALAAEFGKATIYCYFASKEDLYQAVIEDVLEDLATVVREAIQADVPYPERIERLIRSTIDAALAAPEGLCLIARELHATVPQLDVRSRTYAILGPIAEMFREEQEAGRLVKEIRAANLAQVLLMMILGAFLGIIRSDLVTSGACPVSASAAAIVEEDSMQQAVDDAVATVSIVFLHGATARAPARGAETRRRRNPALS